MTRWVWRIGAGVCIVGLLGATSTQDQLQVPADLGAIQSDTVAVQEPPPLRISMEFEDAELRDVLRAFSQQTGINVIAGEAVGRQLVTLYLEDVTAMDALDQILEASGLMYERPAGSQIYIVRPRIEPAVVEEVTTVTRVYRLKFARVSRSHLARAAEALATFVPQGTAEEASGAAGSVGLSDEEVGIDQILEGLLTDVGKVEIDGRTNSLIVTDVEDNFPRIESVLQALDIRTAQILIEAEVLETALDKIKDLGVEWGTGTEGDFVDFTLGSRSTRFPWMFGRMAPDITAANRKFTASTLDARDTVGILQALERDVDTTILARPKILTLDNERAVIQLTTDQAIGFTTTTGETSGTTTSEPERTTTGIVLVVTPQINDDGYVSMLVEPSVTKVVTASVTPPANSGTVVDPKTRSARALVRIQDGNTLVIGGLIDRSDSETIRRVPGLAAIPVLGKVFTNKEIDNDATELVVFVTPHVVGEPVGSQVAAADYETAFPIRAQEVAPSRQELIEETLERLERPPL